MFILILEMNCVRPIFSLGCDLKPWNFQCLLWAVFGSHSGEEGFSMGLSHRKAGRQQWNSFALWTALLHLCQHQAIKAQLQSSHISHWTGKGPSWGWSELAGSSCHDCPPCWKPAGSQLRPVVPACITGRSPPVPGGMPEGPQASICASGFQTHSSDIAQGIPLL